MFRGALGERTAASVVASACRTAPRRAGPTIDSRRRLRDPGRMGKDVFRLDEYPVHLGLGARVVVEERFTGAME